MIKLSEKVRCGLNAWYQNWTSDDWDRQMEADTNSGRFEALVREADDAFGQGDCWPFP